LEEAQLVEETKPENFAVNRLEKGKSLARDVCQLMKNLAMKSQASKQIFSKSTLELIERKLKQIFRSLRKHVRY
jgi:hypothetical protein